MEVGLLGKVFGTAGDWHGSCVVVLDAEATIKSSGPDSISGGGAKVYSPRVSSGRVPADAVCFLAEDRVLLLIQRTVQRQQTGEDFQQDTLFMVDIQHVVGLEFQELDVLDKLGVPYPILAPRRTYSPGTLVG